MIASEASGTFKEPQILLYMTHVQTYYLNIEKIDNDLYAMIVLGMKQASAKWGILMPNSVTNVINYQSNVDGTFGIKEKVTSVSFYYILDDGSIRTETLSVSRDSIPIQLSSEYCARKKLDAIACIDVYDQINAQHRKLEEGCWTKNGWWLKINNTMAWIQFIFRYIIMLSEYLKL